jgi:hypothetical protein
MRVAIATTSGFWVGLPERDGIGSGSNRCGKTSLPVCPSVLSTTRYPETVWDSGLMPYDRFLRLQDFAEFFAELRALHAPIAPMTPFYSVENITTPAFSSRLLTDRL